MEQAVVSGTGMFSSVTSSLLSGVLDEVKGLLPVVLPVAIGYIAFRKGLGFLFGTLRKA